MASSLPNWGAFAGMEYNEKAAQDEAEKLRREFDAMCTKIVEDPHYFQKLSQETAADMGPLPSERQRPRGASDVLGDGRLMKRSVKALARAGEPRRPRYGDWCVAHCTFSVGGDAVLDTRGQRPVRFVVGALCVPQVLSLCAAALAVDETADFEAAESLAFGDDRFAPHTPALSSRGPARVHMEVIDVEAGSAEIDDISGALGQGAILKRRLRNEGDLQRATARCDVAYERIVYALEPRAFVMPVQDVPPTFPVEHSPQEPFVFGTPPGESAAEALGLSVATVASEGRILEHATRKMSTCSRSAPSTRFEDDSYVERLLVESMTRDEECLALLSPVAARRYGWDHQVLVRLRSLEWIEYEECAGERFDAVTKRTLRAGDGGCPRDADIVVVRGLVKTSEGRVVCAYGSDVADSGAHTLCASWTVDDDYEASVGDSGILKAPLCAGVELAIKKMRPGEVAEVTLNAEDLAFVRTPPSATPPTHARPRDIDAFHYARGYANLEPGFAFSSNLVAKLELVDVQPLVKALGPPDPRPCAGLLAPDTIVRATAFRDARADTAYDDAAALKALGNAHFNHKSYDRAARRFSDALQAVAVGVEGLAAEGLVVKQPGARTSALFHLDRDQLPSVVLEEVDEVAKEDDKADAERQDRANDLQNLRLTLLLNRAACDLKRCRYQRCLEDCAAVLAFRPKDVKAFYRTGLAHVALRNFREARDAFNMCIVIDSKCKDARRGLAVVDKLERDARTADASTAEEFKTNGSFAGTRRRNDAKSGPNAPPDPTPMTEKEQLYHDYLADLEHGKPPWIRGHLPDGPPDDTPPEASAPAARSAPPRRRTS